MTAAPATADTMTAAATTAVSGAARSAGRRSGLELLTGVVVLALLGGVLGLAMLGRHASGDGGYPVHATFSQIDGLDIGSDVRLAGITVGHVTQESVDPGTFQARVTFTLAPNLKLPVDSSAIITSDSLLGGKYIALAPGGSDKLIEPGETLTQTQGAISLEQLLSKFIFSVTDSLQQSRKSAAPAAGDQPLKDQP